jgi:putative PIN family toxin of toxin-antitoxin system
MKAERFVVDSNVLISAALRGNSPPARLIAAMKNAAAILVFSGETQAEFASRLMKSKFDRYVSTALREKFLAQVDAVSEYVFIANRPMGCRDRSDDKFLETAVCGRVDCLVSGNTDLLRLHPFQGIPILQPAQCLTRYFSCSLV